MAAPERPAVRHVFSEHAKLRRREFGVTENEVEAVIADADVSWCSTTKCGTVYRRGELAVVVASNGTIITVLRNSTEHWERPCR